MDKQPHVDVALVSPSRAKREGNLWFRRAMNRFQQPPSRTHFFSPHKRYLTTIGHGSPKTCGCGSRLFAKVTFSGPAGVTASFLMRWGGSAATSVGNFKTVQAINVQDLFCLWFSCNFALFEISTGSREFIRWAVLPTCVSQHSNYMRGLLGMSGSHAETLKVCVCSLLKAKRCCGLPAAADSPR